MSDACSGLLRRDVALLRRHADHSALGEGEPDGQARWDVLGEPGTDRGGSWVIADEEEVVPAECMGQAAFAELFR